MFKFCTLFDSGYMNRGIAMYYSLKRHCAKFTLYILAFDDLCFETLKKMNLENVTLISLKEFENTELLKIKQERSRAEYCWTCSSSLVLYCIENYKLDICTYLDADIYFYNSPEIILNEIKNNSVLITKHNYTKEYDQSQTSGIYCVQFVTFRNDKNGMTVLKWWRDRCIEWCYARSEDGKFGDQKYLDDWPEKFEGVHVVKNPGAGIAPWNIQRYNFKVKNTRIYGCEKNTDLTFPVIFFHFHYIKFYTSNFIDISDFIRDKIIIIQSLSLIHI